MLYRLMVSQCLSEPQRTVAFLMPVRVVQPLEVVEVAECQRERSFLAQQPSQLRLERGQPVLDALVSDLADGRRVGLDGRPDTGRAHERARAPVTSVVMARL